MITYRIAELIRRGAAPERILSVTFTNKAAREMQQRTAPCSGRRGPAQSPSSPRSTRSVCRILRQETPALGYPANFSIFDRSDQESAARCAPRNSHHR